MTPQGLVPSAGLRRTLLIMKRAVIGIILLLTVTSAVAQQSDFRWATNATDRAVFQQVEVAFKDELTPDREDSQSHTAPMTRKFIERIGLQGHAALVIIGERENKNDTYAVFRAFNFNLRNKTRSQIRGKEAEWLWMLRVEKLAHLSSPEETDVIFDFLTCTECEADRVLAAFHYVQMNGNWELRQWGQDGAAVMIASDDQFGDDGIYHYDCLHAVADLTGDGLDDLAVRCRESVQPDPNSPVRRITRDDTFLYTSKNGTITRIVITKTSAQATAVRSALCAAKPTSPLCRKSPSASVRP